MNSDASVSRLDGPDGALTASLQHHVPCISTYTTVDSFTGNAIKRNVQI